MLFRSGTNFQQVLTLEIDAALASSAQRNLHNAGVYNAEVRCSDGAALVSNPESALALGGSFDVIVLSGSVASVPPQLLALLKMGGRLSAIVGDEPVMRATLITRVGEAAWHTTQAWDTVAPRLLNFAEPSRFQF